MDVINSAVQFIMSDAGWGQIVTVLAALHAIALVIVNLTPTPKDDEWVGKIYGYVEKAAGILHPNAKLLPGEVLPSTLVK